MELRAGFARPRSPRRLPWSAASRTTGCTARLKPTFPIFCEDRRGFEHEKVLGLLGPETL